MLSQLGLEGVAGDGGGGGGEDGAEDGFLVGEEGCYGFEIHFESSGGRMTVAI